MTTVPEVAKEVKWRGSIYKMEKVEDGKVYWLSPVSQHRQTCSIESWNLGQPYEGKGA
jgi:hypothetical protein